jgi:hypothetical protein
MHAIVDDMRALLEPFADGLLPEAVAHLTLKDQGRG